MNYFWICCSLYFFGSDFQTASQYTEELVLVLDADAYSHQISINSPFLDLVELLVVGENGVWTGQREVGAQRWTLMQVDGIEECDALSGFLEQHGHQSTVATIWCFDCVIMVLGGR